MVNSILYTLWFYKEVGFPFSEEQFLPYIVTTVSLSKDENLSMSVMGFLDNKRVEITKNGKITPSSEIVWALAYMRRVGPENAAIGEVFIDPFHSRLWVNLGWRVFGRSVTVDLAATTAYPPMISKCMWDTCSVDSNRTIYFLPTITFYWAL